MTPETFVIILVIIGCVTVVSVISQIFNKPGRDYAARDRDHGLAKLYEARAELLHTESIERRRVLSDLATKRRQEACSEVRKS